MIASSFGEADSAAATAAAAGVAPNLPHPDPTTQAT